MEHGGGPAGAHVQRRAHPGRGVVQRRRRRVPLRRCLHANAPANVPGRAPWETRDNSMGVSPSAKETGWPPLSLKTEAMVLMLTLEENKFPLARSLSRSSDAVQRKTPRPYGLVHSGLSQNVLKGSPLTSYLPPAKRTRGPFCVCSRHLNGF